MPSRVFWSSACFVLVACSSTTPNGSVDPDAGGPSGVPSGEVADAAHPDPSAADAQPSGASPDAAADVHDAADGSATADAGRDGESHDAAPDHVASDSGNGSCVIKRAHDYSECADDCDGQLELPGGDVYCSVECTKPSECAALDPTLTCSPNIGACTPKCSSNTTCTTLGFKRCDMSAGACDTQ